MKIRKRSIMSGEYNSMDIEVTIKQLADWEGGKLIQNVMPELSSDEREFIMTGITPEEWKSLMETPS